MIHTCRYRITFFIFVLFVSSLLSSAQSAGAPALDNDPAARVRCGGCLARTDLARLQRLGRNVSSESAHGRCLVVRGLPVCFDSTLDAADSAYVVELLDMIIPFMTQVVGPPLGLDTLTIELQDIVGASGIFRWDNHIVVHHRGGSAGVDSDRDGLVDEDPYDGRDNDADGRIDEDGSTSSYWDNIFIHELAHAFQTDVLWYYPSWVVEGMAECAEYFVSDAATRAIGDRNFRYREHDAAMATFDLIDHGAGQLWGGEVRLIETPDPIMAYFLAGSSLLLPMLAEIEAGHADPHPLARLTAELRQPPFFEAVDRAWSVPIDGITPPSRWLRGRALANPVVREGNLVEILPLRSAVNTALVDMLYWNRDSFGNIVGLRQEHPLCVIDTKGNRVQIPSIHWNNLPGLAPGAYLVEGEEADGTKTLKARTWVYMSSTEKTFDGREGTFVIFVGRDGRPVDLPDVAVNGRVLERVPGGMKVIANSVISPDDAFTFSLNGRVLGTVTRAGEFTRVVPLFVDDPYPAGALSWEPYHPIAGRPLTLVLRASESALSTGDVPVTAWLLSGFPDLPLVESPVQETSVPDVYTAEFEVPEDWTFFDPQFFGTLSNHGDCQFWACSRVKVAPLQRVEAVQVGRIANELCFRLNFEVDEDSLRLFHADRPEGPWTESSARPRRDPSQSFAWIISLEPDPRSTRLARLTYGEGDNRHDLFQGTLGSLDPRPGIRSLPVFPNPSPDGIRWTVESDGFFSLTFEVFDASGRRVHGPEPVTLAPGRRELRWNGTGAGRRVVPSGIYLLRLSGPNVDLTRKSVLVENRPGR